MSEVVVYGIVLGVAAIFLIVYFYNSYRRSLAQKARIAAEYGQVPIWALDERDYNSMKNFYCQKPSEGAVIDDITWADLNMDAVFKRFKNTQSSVGDEFCYKFLRQQKNNDLQHLENAAKDMGENQQKREKLQFAFSKIGRETDNKLIDLIMNPEKFSKIPFAAIVLVTLLGLASLVWLFIDAGYGIIATVISFSIALILFYYVMSKISSEVKIMGMFVQMVKSAKLLVKLDVPAFRREAELLKQNLKVFNNINSFADIIIKSSVVGPDGGGGNILTIIISYFGLYGFAYNSLVKHFIKHRQQVLELYETIGYAELCISVASYRESLDYYCRPEFCENSKIDFEGIYHPLLKKFVANTRIMGNKAIITGSNASGKSTFARTLSVNVILGQLINTCLANKYVFKPCAVYTSMNLQDDITTGDSFYVAEVKSLKRLINKAEEKTYTMLLLDEIFKGTNMVERIAAASVILKRLADMDCFVCLATHDLELCRILKNSYENYHFQEQITDDSISFDYKLRDGITTGSNAIKLLSYCNYEPDIILQAEKQVEKYRQSGEWEVF